MALELAKSDVEAYHRFLEWKAKDPFPHIEPALLNSADIMAYIKTTSLIYPFDPDRLKGASYDVPIKGEVIYWDENHNNCVPRRILLNKNGDSFDLLPNSIAFVTLEPTFRIPNYLALRFNLKITHIYKGLLLGTGPLVDPGFCGRLSIPLHNLTNNTYRFVIGDELITMEFTKLSPNASWNPSISNSSIGHDEVYKENKIKSNRTVEEYVRKALKNDRLPNVISSIPGKLLSFETVLDNARTEVNESIKKVNDVAEDTSEKAKKSIEKARQYALIQTIGTLIAVAALVVSCMVFSFDAVNKANELYDSLIEKYQEMQTQYSAQIASLKESIADLSSGSKP